MYLLHPMSRGSFQHQHLLHRSPSTPQTCRGLEEIPFGPASTRTHR